MLHKLFSRQYFKSYAPLLTFLFLLLPFIFLISAGGSEARQGKPLNWSMALMNVSTGDLVPFSAPVQSRTGEQFRLIIDPETDCFFYMISESPGDNGLEVLYDGALLKGEWYSPVMVLSPPEGSESLFVIASLAEQKDLAQRISSVKANPSTANKRALMNEVFRLRSEISKFKEEPEKPVLMGGAARGASENSQGLEFSGLDAYVKTISIEH